MGLYNMIFGINSHAPYLLLMLHLTPQACGRFRDAHVANGEIAIYTRNGGGNREEYMPDFSEHQNYLRDKDDDFDNTYATIYFSVPDEYKLEASVMETGAWKPDDRWHAAIDALKKG